MIGIIDYGVGNIFSIQKSLEYLGIDSKLISDPELLKKYDKIILPGVGAFMDAKNKLRDSGMEDSLFQEVKRGKELLGICLGMQLLMDKSWEGGAHVGLGLIPGEVKAIRDITGDNDLIIPEMGWNSLELTEPRNGVFRYTESGEYVYFVHSYAAYEETEWVSAYNYYGERLVAGVEKDNIHGVQFHPEKSGEAGFKILKAFNEI